MSTIKNKNLRKPIKAKNPKPGSEHEELFLFLLRANGFPIPNLQHKPNPNRDYSLDFAWPIAKVAVEVQGGHWAQGRARKHGGKADIEKLNWLQYQGWLVLQATPDMIKDNSILLMLFAALESRHLLWEDFDERGRGALQVLRLDWEKLGPRHPLTKWYKEYYWPYKEEIQQGTYNGSFVEGV